MEHEHEQLLDLRVTRPHAGGNDLTELESFHPLRDGLQVVGIVVLAVDENDFLGTSGDEYLAVVEQGEVARAEPAILGERRGVGFRVLEVPAGDVVTTHFDVADPVLGQHVAFVVRQAYLTVRNHLAFGDELDGILVGFRDGLDRAAHIQLVTVERDRAHRGADLGEGDGERGFRETVHRKHRVPRELRGLHALEELVAELDRDGLRTVENEPGGR